MKLQNDLGEIRISSEVFTAVTGCAATNCYGVKGMAVRSKTDGLVHLLKRESMAKGVKVYYNEDGTVSSCISSWRTGSTWWRSAALL